MKGKPTWDKAIIYDKTSNMISVFIRNNETLFKLSPLTIILKLRNNHIFSKRPFAKLQLFSTLICISYNYKEYVFNIEQYLSVFIIYMLNL